jgi:hypothetical protein
MDSMDSTFSKFDGNINPSKSERDKYGERERAPFGSRVCRKRATAEEVTTSRESVTYMIICDSHLCTISWQHSVKDWNWC